MRNAPHERIDEWIDRDCALTKLGVRPQTLYAYVSRGLLRARPDAADPRRSAYSGHDIDALLARKRGSRRRADIASGAIAWGEPVLDSALSTVRDGRLIYRGRDAADLAAKATLEDAAALLWQCAPPDAHATASDKRTAAAPNSSREAARERAFRYLAREAATQPPALRRSKALLQADAWLLLGGFADAISGANGDGPIHARLARRWRLDRRGADLVRRALVLICDHELNASTFTVRVAASTGGSLAAAVLAGFCALSGPLHGQASARALELLDRIMQAGDARAYVRAAIERGEPMLGLGHPLYPGGDVRALALLKALKPGAKISRALRVAENEVGGAANVDMALAAMTRELRLPDDAPFVIFAAGRMAGWLAHAIEQRETGRLIRPRARYTGL